MKTKKTHKEILRIVQMLFLVCVLSLGILWNYSIPISAAVYEASALDDASGSFYLGLAPGIKDPEKITNDSGYYYSPSAYVYFGRVYNDAKGVYEPILCRVLDADADNTGKAGAMFVLTEKAVRANDSFSSQHESFNNYSAYENVYTESLIHKSSYIYATQLFPTHAYIRQITKNDVLANMSGAFGFTDEFTYQWETNEYDGNDDVYVKDEAKLLNGDKIFMLSVEELLQYVGNYNGVPGMGTTHIISKASTTWWLRTGLNDLGGNLVGAVDESGRVIAMSADDSTVAGRYALNIETGDISYTQNLGNNVYKLAFNHPTYKDSDVKFSAEVDDVNGREITVKYSGYLSNAYYNDETTNFISVIIKDKMGAVKYYGSIEAVPQAADSNTIKNDERTVSFTLPADYIDGDTVSVFLEKKYDNGEKTSFTSNMVELDCIHELEVEATCASLAICGKCKEEFGYLNKENHTNIGTELYYDDETDTHWNVCNDCEERTKVESCKQGFTCVAFCKCGNIDIAYDMHHFDENGVCTHDKTHFENPVREDKGAISNFEIYNEGQFISLAKYVNSIADNKLYNEYGEFWGYPSIVELKADLDFTNIEGFVPMGSEESPFDALTFDGCDHTVSGINCDFDGAYVGLFGVVKNTRIENIKLKNSSFTGTSAVSALIGKATGVEVSYVTVDGVTLTAADGCVGSVMAISDEDSEIIYSISYDALNEDGLKIAFTSDKNAVISDSYCLAESYNAATGEMTAEQFASGELGYLYSQLYSIRHGKYGGQKIGVDKYPYFGGMTVYMAQTCDGETVYFNDKSLKEQIEAHNYTAFADEEPEFIWESKMGTETYNCFVSAVCGDCGHTGLTAVEVVMDDTRVPVRADWTATITLGGVTKTESRTSFAIHIQDMIGMTDIVKDFDGSDVLPDDLMTNHRLQTDPPAYKEYEVFFVNPETGERYSETAWDWYGKPYQKPIGVSAAGTYDLLVIGKNDYEGQEYTFESALVINPITVTVTPLDIYKHYDGSTDLEAKYTLDNENAYGDWFELVLDRASSADVGEYTVRVSIKYNSRAYNYEAYKSSVTLVLDRDTVGAVILPALYQSIENKNYPTEFTYGDVIPVPTAEHFTVFGGGELSFEWYKVRYEYYGGEPIELIAIDGVPKDAGDYILRVRAEATERLLSTYADFEITIDSKWLWIRTSVDEETETVSLGNSDYYVVDSLDEVTAIIVDENGEIFRSHGVALYQRFTYEGMASNNTRRCYRVGYYPVLEDSVVSPYNYNVIYDSIYLALPADEDSFVRDITMLVKECSIDLSSPNVEFDIRNVVMKAGEVFLLGHTLVDVRLVIDRENGEILIAEFKVVDEEGNDVSYLYRPITYISNWAHENGGNNVVHIFDNPCDTDCNVDDCTFVRSAHHIGGTATCTTPAICTDCGELYGEVNKHNHIASDVIITPNPDDLLTHLVMHSCCAGVVEVMEHTAISPATCTERAVCSICDWTYGELDPTNHSSEECSYTQNTKNAGDHLKTHLCCGVTESEAHSGGEATCIESATCEYCKTHYGEIDADNHAELPTIVPSESDASMHNINYACCGFAISEEHSGGEATCIAIKICEKCDTGYGVLDPANHANEDITYLIREDNATMHDLYHSCCHEYIDKEYHTGGVATCASEASCEYCGALYGVLDPSNHSSDEYSYTKNPLDENRHLKMHACCGKEISDEEHSGGEANCLHGTLCEYCGADYGEKTDHAYDNSCDAICNVCGELTRALSFHADDDGNGQCDVCAIELPREQLSGGGVSAIVTSSTVVAGVGGFSLFWFVIKKKSWSALLKLLLG